MSIAEPITVAEALSRFPGLRRLHELALNGRWRFAHLHDGQGVTCVVAFCSAEWHTDALYVYGEEDCLAVRLRPDVPGVRGGIVWDYLGSLVTCIDELINLPHPLHPQAPWLVKAPGSVLVVLP